MLRLTLLTLFVLTPAIVDAHDSVDALVIFPQNYGANALFYLNDFRRFGWHITTAGTADTIASCGSFADPVGCPPIGVDILLEDITDITAYDVVAIMSSAQAGTPPAQDLLQSQHALDLIHTAADSGIVLAAWCASVRVLAAADVLDGINVTGSATYQGEYEAAGATFVGGNHYPVVDGTIVTCTRGRYYHQQNSNAVARALEQSHDRNVVARRAWLHLDDRAARSRDDAIWSTMFGGSGEDVALGICPATGGGFAVVGLTYSQGAGMSDVYLGLLNSEGEVLWSRVYGGPGWEAGTTICPAQGGGYLIAGSTTSAGAGGKDMLLLKVDESGNELWSRTFGGSGMDLAASVVQDADGNVMVLGHTESFGAGEDDLYLVKTDADGNELWTKLIGSASSEMGGAVSVTSEGGYVIAASTGGSGAANRDVWLLKLSADGMEQWSRVYDGVSGAPEAAMDEGHAVVETPDGGYVVAGVSDRPIPSTAGDLLCAFVIRTDPVGTELWRRRYGENPLQDHARSLVYADGALVLAGATTDAVTMRTDAYVVAMDLDGAELWRKVIGGDQVRWGNAIAAAPGAVAIAGYAQSEFSGREAWAFQLSTLLPRFSATPSSGHAPLSVQFNDQSLGAATTWSWDLDGDGSPESDQQSPLWTYDTPGEYAVSLAIANDQSTADVTVERCIRVFDGESALEFDGHSGSATCVASPSLAFSEAVTLEAVIKPLGWGESSALGYGRIADKTSFALYLHGEGPTYNDHSLLFLVKNASGPPRVSATPINSITLGRWQHVAAAYDATAGLEVYIEGERQELTHSDPPTGSIRDNAALDLVIGNTESGSYTFDGIVDEVRVWHVARSEEEIRSAMHLPLHGDEPALAGYWRMNEGWGDSLCDGSPNGNTAAVVGAAWAQGAVPVGQDPRDPQAGGSLPVFTISHSAPNPSRGITSLSIDVPAPSAVDVAIFDLSGRRIRRVLRGTLTSGTHVVHWDGFDERGAMVPSGPYVWVVRDGNLRRAHSVMLTR
ncbi:MAG: DJ-1/PfpI family protein [Candidatus Eisenbacteria bacterium]|nr:DJ-1/PfpI family protein [Candidatus Eisenbacteria bacterium]